MKSKYFIAPNAWGIFCGVDNVAWVDSRTVAVAFGKAHTDVLDAIENLDCSVYFRKLNFELSEYEGKDGKHRPCYNMTREGFTALANSYIKEEYKQLRKEFFKRFDEKENLVNDKLGQKYRGAKQ